MGRISAGFGSVHGPGKKRRAGRGTGGLPPLSLFGLSPPGRCLLVVRARTARRRRGCGYAAPGATNRAEPERGAIERA